MNSRLRALLVLAAFPAAAVAQADPHEIFDLAPTPFCTDCHRQLPALYPSNQRHSIQPDQAAFRVDGNSMCESCHDSHDMHTVGVVIEFPTPQDLPLDSERKITCLTCHYAHGRLKSDRPWAAVSFLDRMLNHDDMHKSYLLRRNNSSGELCLVCHRVEEARK